jgi:hypothetical protein
MPHRSRRLDRDDAEAEPVAEGSGERTRFSALYAFCATKGCSSSGAAERLPSPTRTHSSVNARATEFVRFARRQGYGRQELVELIRRLSE